jgi:hypothetical protein
LEQLFTLFKACCSIGHNPTLANICFYLIKKKFLFNFNLKFDQAVDRSATRSNYYITSAVLLKINLAKRSLFKWCMLTGH